MSEKKIAEILWQVYTAEYEEFESVPIHKFSTNHRLEIKKIKKIYYNINKELKIKKIFLVAAVAAVTALLLTITAVAVITGGFKFTETSKYTEVNPIISEPLNESDDYIYIIKGISQKYDKEIIANDENIKETLFTYENQYILFSQIRKDAYTATYNTEKYELIEFSLGEGKAFKMKCDEETVIVWEENSFVFELIGNIDENELINLAKSTEIEEVVK